MLKPVRKNTSPITTKRSWWRPPVGAGLWCTVILFTLLEAANLRWIIVYSDWGNEFWIQSFGGAVSICWGGYHGGDTGLADGLGSVPIEFREALELFHTFGLRGIELSDGYLRVPNWLIIVPALVLLGVLRAGRKHRQPGMCLKCGYDVSMSMSNRCSECGTEIAVLPKDDD